MLPRMRTNVDTPEEYPHKPPYSYTPPYTAYSENDGSSPNYIWQWDAASGHLFSMNTGRGAAAEENVARQHTHVTHLNGSYRNLEQRSMTTGRGAAAEEDVARLHTQDTHLDGSYRDLEQRSMTTGREAAAEEDVARLHTQDTHLDGSYRDLEQRSIESRDDNSIAAAAQGQNDSNASSPRYSSVEDEDLGNPRPSSASAELAICRHAIAKRNITIKALKLVNKELSTQLLSAHRTIQNLRAVISKQKSDHGLQLSATATATLRAQQHNLGGYDQVQKLQEDNARLCGKLRKIGYEASAICQLREKIRARGLVVVNLKGTHKKELVAVLVRDDDEKIKGGLLVEGDGLDEELELNME